MGLIYFDTCLLIYLLESHAVFSASVRQAMMQAPTSRFAILPLVKFECLVAPLRHVDLVLQRSYEALFDRFEMLSLPEPMFLQGARLRARFGLKTPDALHLACAQHHRCEALWTHDERLVEAGHGLVVNILASQG